MSKRFKRQDYFRYSRTGMKWRRPKGLQSKQRLEKGGSGLVPKIGYGSKDRKIIPTISNVTELSCFEKDSPVLISASVGARKAIDIYNKAKELGLVVKNMKKVKRAKRISKKIEVDKKMKQLEKKQKTTDNEKKVQ